MGDKSKQIRFQEDHLGGSDLPTLSSHSRAPSVASSHEHTYPRTGTTRIPARLISNRALAELRYPFVEEGNTVVVLLALGQENIDELLKLSAEYKLQEGDDIEQAGDRKTDDGDLGFDWINVDTQNKVTSTSGSIKHNESSNEISSTSSESESEFSEGPVVHSGLLNLNVTKSLLEDDPSNAAAKRLGSWTNEIHELVGGSTTQLFTINAAEYYMDRAGNQRVTLVCPVEARNGGSDPSLVRMRWLHLQASSLKVSTLEDLVADCLYISQSLKSVALTVLKEVKTRCEKSSETGSYIEPGSTVRYVGRYNSSLGKYRYDDTSDTEPVIFFSAPYLLLTENIPRQRFNGNHYMRSLLEVLYGYDDGTSQKTANGAQNIFSNEEGKWRTLQVPQLWSLIVGADLVITCSELSAQEIQQDYITVDRKLSPSGSYTIRLIDVKDMCRYHVVIEPDCKYVDFLRHAVALVRASSSDATAYILVDESGTLLTPDRWLNLLENGQIEDYIFGLRTDDAVHDTPNDEFRALSAKLLTSGSRSSLGTYSRRR
ncbi:hypothetical protein EsH8_I_000109 [Colletotrichum jinshuiense]